LLSDILGRDGFVGRWSVGRVITDHRGAVEGVFDGIAVISAEGEAEASYAEEGLLRMGDGPQMTATRRYLWRFAGAAVEVFFADGRPFHDFRLDAGEVAAEHLCGADLYRVRYGFGSWPVWTARWQVQGPRKDYAMVSQYRRASQA
jgi:hypothetical protein